jgi:Gpi18-like mannosyltransferase
LPVEARIFIAALAFRLFSALAGYLANVTLPQYQDQGFGVFPRQDHPFWDAFARHDSGWYHAIAANGYEYGGAGRNNLAFFPAYPLLMRAGGWVLGGRQQDYYFAGIVVSWLAFAGAMTMLYRLALLDLARPAALRAVMYAAIFPFAYFFGMVYSESLFLFALVTAAYAFRTQA